MFTSLQAIAVIPQPPTALCVDSDCSSTEHSSKGAGAIKWQPGQYVWFMPPAANGIGGFRIDLAGHRNTILSFIDATVAREPSIKGIQLVVYWKALEGDTAGDYSQGFAAIDAILSRLQQHNKHLMLSLQPLVFGNFAKVTDVLPAYLANDPDYGYSQIGVHAGTVGGITARTWQAPTMDRMIALSAAYGKRYNSHPNLQMIAFAESSLEARDSGFDNYKLTTQLKRMLVSARKHWPNTNVRMNANWLSPDSQMISLAQTCLAMYCVWGGPDVLPAEAVQANQVFTGAIGNFDYRGKIPFVSEVQSPELGGKEGSWTPSQLHSAAVNGYTAKAKAIAPVRPQFFIWYHNTWQGTDAHKWPTGILPFIRSIEGKVVNGLTSTLAVPGSLVCPSAFAGGCDRT